MKFLASNLGDEISNYIKTQSQQIFNILYIVLGIVAIVSGIICAIMIAVSKNNPELRKRWISATCWTIGAVIIGYLIPGIINLIIAFGEKNYRDDAQKSVAFRTNIWELNNSIIKFNLLTLGLSLTGWLAIISVYKTIKRPRYKIVNETKVKLNIYENKWFWLLVINVIIFAICLTLFLFSFQKVLW